MTRPGWRPRLFELPAVGVWVAVAAVLWAVETVRERWPVCSFPERGGER